MEYFDFELRIGLGKGHEYPVSVIKSPAGETSEIIPLPIEEPEFKDQLELLGYGHLFSKNSSSRSLIFPDETDPKLKEPAARKFGELLFETLMKPEIRSCYRSSLNKARETNKGLRIRLRIEAPELATIPWEYLYDKREGDFLCLSVETPLIRYMELERPVQTLRIKPPIHILGMIASPKELPKLDIEYEQKLMANAIEHLVDAGTVTLTWLEGQTWRDLQMAMRKGEWHVFHYIGHGGYDEENKEGYLGLADEEGHLHKLSGKNLGRLLKGHNPLRLAVLNACEGGRASEDDLFSSTGTMLIRSGVPSVISMQYPITDKAALEFSRTFYDFLAMNSPIETSVAEARKAIDMAARQGTLEWGTPVLHLRAPDGQLFHVDVAGAVLEEKTPAETRKPAPISTPKPIVDQGQNSQKGLKNLLGKVKQYWIKGVLENSFQYYSPISLELDTKPEMVNSPFGEFTLSAQTSVADVYEEIGGSFLILGIPGSGKTTALLTLAKDLIEYAEKDPNHPIPVVVNLSSWAESATSISQWLLGELRIKYLIPPRISQRWLADNKLILLLDGLDEVRETERAACVEAINAFAEESLTGMVICSRLNEYISLPSRLHLTGAVSLRKLTREQVFSYLEAAGDSVLSLLEIILHDSSLLILAQTPFMLSLMVHTFQDESVEGLVTDQLDSLEVYKQRIMAAFVQHQFRMATH